MNKIKKIFEIARKAALKGCSDYQRGYFFGCVGIRKDGTIVISSNLANKYRHPSAHAEFRLTRKLDKGSVVYVVRVSKTDGSLLLAAPCPWCHMKMEAKGVAKVIYSINDYDYGVLAF